MRSKNYTYLNKNHYHKWTNLYSVFIKFEFNNKPLNKSLNYLPYIYRITIYTKIYSRNNTLFKKRIKYFKKNIIIKNVTLSPSHTYVINGP